MNSDGRIPYRTLLPWLLMFRAIGLALSVRQLAVAAAALVVIWQGNRWIDPGLADALFPAGVNGLGTSTIGENRALVDYRMGGARIPVRAPTDGRRRGHACERVTGFGTRHKYLSQSMI